MNVKTQLELSLDPAKTMAEQAPHELPVLRIFQRPNVGTTVRLCAIGAIGLSGRARGYGKNARIRDSFC